MPDTPIEKGDPLWSVVPQEDLEPEETRDIEYRKQHRRHVVERRYGVPLPISLVPERMINERARKSGTGSVRGRSLQGG